jgi:broad specificity phosphatase PhoE
MKIYFARHGESQANIQRVFSNRGLKHPLTPAGRLQAAQLARRLQDRSVTCIYSSPVLRAVETSIVVAHALGIDYEVADALRENDVGVLEGRADDEAWQAIRLRLRLVRRRGADPGGAVVCRMEWGSAR